VELEVAKVEKESEIITSFYLRRADGAPLYRWEPGQFLPIRVTIPGHARTRFADLYALNLLQPPLLPVVDQAR
jgi:ferredoxin-NADP reductase